MRSLLPLCCLLVVGGCAVIVTPNDGNIKLSSPFGSEAVTGDGRLVQERRTVANLASLDVAGPLQVEVRVGPAPSLAIAADSNLVPLIRSEVAGSTLRIWVDGAIRSANPMRVVYTVPQLTHLRASGSGRLSVADLNGASLNFTKSGSGTAQLSGRVDNLAMQLSGSGHVNATALQSGNAQLNLSGSGRLNLGQLRADAVSISVSGSGAVEAGGAARSLSAQVSGSGGANLASLASEQADLLTSGSGAITAQVNRSLVARTNGSGRITVYGNPAQRSISGKHVQVLN